MLKAWYPSCKVRISSKKWSTKVDHLKMDEGWSDDPSLGDDGNLFSGFPSTVRKVSSFQVRTPKIPKGITKITVVKVIITVVAPPDSTEQKFHGIAMVSCKMTNKSTGEKKTTSSHEENVRSVNKMKGIWQFKDLTKTYFTFRFFLVSSQNGWNILQLVKHPSLTNQRPFKLVIDGKMVACHCSWLSISFSCIPNCIVFTFYKVGPKTS